MTWHRERGELTTLSVHRAMMEEDHAKKLAKLSKSAAGVGEIGYDLRSCLLHRRAPLTRLPFVQPPGASDPAGQGRDLQLVDSTRGPRGPASQAGGHARRLLVEAGVKQEGCEYRGDCKSER